MSAVPATGAEPSPVTARDDDRQVTSIGEAVYAQGEAEAFFSASAGPLKFDTAKEYQSVLR